MNREMKNWRQQRQLFGESPQRVEKKGEEVAGEG